MKTSRMWAGVAAALLLSAWSAAANGNRAKKEFYDGKIGQVAFSVELEPIPFQVSTVQNRYRLIRIRIVNDGATPLSLSARADKVVGYTGEGEVDGIVDLNRRDAALWDGFSAEVRTMLAYPTVVKAREEESVFVFFDATRLKSAPERLLYTVAGLKEGVTLARRGATRAN